MPLSRRTSEQPRLREGDTDPRVLQMRESDPHRFWKFDAGHAITVGVLVVGLAAAWGRSESIQGTYSKDIDAIKSAGYSQQIIKLDGQVGGLSDRVSVIEGAKIPERMAATDRQLGVLGTKVDDMVKRMDDSRVERTAWQADISLQLRELLTKVTTLAAQSKAREK